MGLFGSLFNNLKGQKTSHSMNTYPQAVISRTKTLEGRYIHSIIQNGGSYFLIDMPVYEDGVVDCWGNVDLEMLKDKILKGWLSPSVPDKERVSKHHLAVWEIESSNWYYNKENYHEFIVSVVKMMNPTLTNLFQSHGQISRIIGNSYYSVLGSAEQLFRKDHPTTVSFKEFKGTRTHFLYKKSENIYWLCNFNIYIDGSILIDGIDAPLHFKNKQDLDKLFQNGTLVTKISDHSTIIIKDLGEIRIAKTLYHVEVNDKYAEIDDIINGLNNQPSTSDECVKIFEEYQKNPTEDNKEKLKTAYEKIPKHLRVYVLKDMDAKDWPIRKIIYEKE